MHKHILQKLRCVITMILVMAITLSTAVTPIMAFERLPDTIATDSNGFQINKQSAYCNAIRCHRERGGISDTI